jgi:hypothetical protein
LLNYLPVDHFSIKLLKVDIISSYRYTHFWCETKVMPEKEAKQTHVQRFAEAALK